VRYWKGALVGAMTAIVPSVSYAGGFDLTGQPIDALFEKGNYIEGRVGVVISDVEGSTPVGSIPAIGPALAANGVGDSSGNIADDIRFLTLAAKTDFTDSLSGAILFDTGTAATVEAETISAVARLKLGENFSVYGGPKLQNARVDLQGPFALNQPGGFSPPFTPFQTLQIDVRDTDVGFVAGVAAEIPRLSIRAALTYNSEVTHDFDSSETFFSAALGDFVSLPSSFEVTTPQSLNLDLQAPLSKSTLLRGNIRYVNWDGVDFDPPNFRAANITPANPEGLPVVEFIEDTITYRLTLAQRFNETLAGFVTGSYEESVGETPSLFKVVDGGFSVGGGVIVNVTPELRMTLGGEYRQLFGIDGQQLFAVPGTSSPTSNGIPVPDSSFGDQDAFAFSVRFGYNF